MNEAEFWRSSPRKVSALWKIHKKINWIKFEEEMEEETRVCIDQVPFL